MNIQPHRILYTAANRDIKFYMWGAWAAYKTPFYANTIFKRILLYMRKYVSIHKIGIELSNFSNAKVQMYD